MEEYWPRPDVGEPIVNMRGLFGMYLARSFQADYRAQSQAAGRPDKARSQVPLPQQTQHLASLSPSVADKGGALQHGAPSVGTALESSPCQGPTAINRSRNLSWLRLSRWSPVIASRSFFPDLNNLGVPTVAGSSTWRMTKSGGTMPLRFRSPFTPTAQRRCVIQTR